MLLAIDILVNKTYTRLPKAIKVSKVFKLNPLIIQARFTPPEPISDEEIRMVLPDLNRIIKYRLSVTPFPRRFTKIVVGKIFAWIFYLNFYIEHGRVVFTVPHEFKVTLTLLSEALDYPWSIIDIEFLVSDPNRSRKYFEILMLNT